MKPTDRVQQQIELQERAFPDLDYSAKAVTGRVIRLASLFVEGLARAVAPFGLNPNEYAIICVLRASGPPFVLAPKAINQALILTSGGLTNLLNALERRGLIERLPDPNDGRGVLIRASRRALNVVDAAIDAHLMEENEMLVALSPAERKRLAALLTKLLVSLDPVPPEAMEVS